MSLHKVVPNLYMYICDTFLIQSLGARDFKVGPFNFFNYNHYEYNKEKPPIA